MTSHLRASASQLDANVGLLSQPSAERTQGEPRLPRRVIVDATYTLGSGRHSGVERVVTNLRLGCEARGTSQGAETATAMSLNGEFYEVGVREKRALDSLASGQANIVACLPKIYRQLMQPLVALTRSSKLKQWLLPDAGHMGVFKLPHRFWYKRALQHVCRSSNRIEPSAGDLLILPDAYWARKEIWSAAEAARKRGAFVAVVVYDLIPLSHPEFVGARRSQRFGDYLRQVAQHADIILTISETVRRELVDTLPGLMGQSGYCQNITSFPLGSEFPPSPGQPRAELLRLFSQSNETNPYLTVAAFDPRKNHRYLLDAFDRFWKQFPERQLCLVGRVGSRCNDVLDRIAKHPALGKQLFTFHDLSDAELQFCYRACRGVIFPSIVEGFGLPIVEAQWHGNRTLASDTPIHREVGGQGCLYFDLANPQTLVDVLAQCERQPELLKQSSEKSGASSWPDCIDLFYEKCVTAFRHSAAEHSLARSA